MWNFDITPVEDRVSTKGLSTSSKYIFANWLTTDYLPQQGLQRDGDREERQVTMDRVAPHVQVERVWGRGRRDLKFPVKT